MTSMVTISHSQCQSLRLRLVGRRQYDVVSVATLHTGHVTYCNSISYTHLITIWIDW